LPEDLDRVERLLLEAEFESMESIWASSNHVFLAQMCVGDERFAAVYKPLDGERPLWDFPGGLYRREVAAYRFARLLGWDFVPPTVERDGTQGVGSLQFAIDHDPQTHFFALREEEEWIPQLKRIAVFDCLANNADRKGGHCLLDSAGVIWGIDHGLCFHEADKLRSVIWDWADEPIAEALLADVERTGRALEVCTPDSEPLLVLLTDKERQALISRIGRLLTRRRFPVPGAERHYPWPLV
jgi:uncharacterized repeat protein (TIGR03843 family)